MKIFATLLACGLAAAGSLEAVARDYGDWRRHTDVSEMTDFENLYFGLTSENEVSDTIGHRRVKPRMFVRCQENKTAVGVDWMRFITSGDLNDRVKVRWRIDDRDPVTERWVMSTNYETTGKWRGSGISMLRGWTGAERFIIEVTPHGENTIRARFDVSGIDAVLWEISERCSWSMEPQVSEPGPRVTEDDKERIDHVLEILRSVEEEEKR